MRWRDRNRLGLPEEPRQQRHLEDPVIHHKAHRARAGCHQHHGVGKAHVVADQHGRALLGNPVGVDAAQPVDRMDQNPGDEAQQELRHQRIDIEGHHGIEQPHHQEQLRDAVASQRHAHAEQRRRDHEEAVQDVVRRNDPRPVRGHAAALDQRIQRHAVEAAEHGQQEQVRQHAPVARIVQEAADAAQRGAGRLAVGGQVQVHGEHGHADGAKRHEADLHGAPRQPLAQQGPHADADREHRQQQRDHVLVPAEHVPGKAEEGRQERGAKEPEPGNAEQAQEHHPPLAREHQVAPRLGQRIPVDAQVRLGRRRNRHALRHYPPRHGDHHAGDAHVERPHHGAVAHHPGQFPADQRADQDGDEGAHFHQPVSAHQFLLVQVLRQVRELHRAE
ncbi:hypothetical protein D3C72_1056990 [compost metagenome]